MENSVWVSHWYDTNIDLRKVFETIKHEILLVTLRALGPSVKITA